MSIEKQRRTAREYFERGISSGHAPVLEQEPALEQDPRENFPCDWTCSFRNANAAVRTCASKSPSLTAA